MDKLFILKIPNLIKRGIFINIIILLWRWKIDNKELFQLKNLEDFTKVLLNKLNIFNIIIKKPIKYWRFPIRRSS